MNLTGKCKKDFEEWFNKGVADKTSYGTYLLGRFYGLHLSMQFGVIQEFADSVGYDMITEASILQDKYWFTIYKQGNDNINDSYFDTRKEAQQAAIAKFNEIYNER